MKARILLRALPALLLLLAIDARAAVVNLFHEAVALNVSAQTTTQTSDEFVVDPAANAGGLLIWLNLTTCTTACDVTLALQVQDPVDGSWRSYFQVPNVIATGDATYLMGQANAQTNSALGVVVERPLPRRFRIQVIHNNANASTYSVGIVTVPR